MARDEKRNPPLEERDDVMIAALQRERDGLMRWPKPDRERIGEIDKLLDGRGLDVRKLEQPKAPQPSAGQRTATR
ncbi:MAG: hypothetical protein A2135_10075 [Actinobacteria bacterium RBG_16_67_15]|nr:MAG: hypothetical protein A2135_10075 [Actinobacteria bacterium RBG_16_67_15]